MKSNEVKADLVGKTVTWESQSRGIRKRKTGVIVAFLRGGENPLRSKAFRDGGYLYKNSMPNPGVPRDHDSFLVNVKGDLYWPRVAGLELVND